MSDLLHRRRDPAPVLAMGCRPSQYSGKLKTTGMSVQVVCTLTGHLARVSDPADGARHDTHCLHRSGVLSGLDLGDWVGDKGYIGNGMITPILKPVHRELLEWEKEFDKQINQIRYVIEQVIANIKNLAYSARRLMPPPTDLHRSHLRGRLPSLLQDLL
jgi:hypothetical protein